MYARNSPVLFIDPSGEQGLKDSEEGPPAGGYSMMSPLLHEGAPEDMALPIGEGREINNDKPRKNASQKSEEVDDAQGQPQRVEQTYVSSGRQESWLSPYVRAGYNVMRTAAAGAWAMATEFVLTVGQGEISVDEDQLTENLKIAGAVDETVQLAGFASSPSLLTRSQYSTGPKQTDRRGPVADIGPTTSNTPNGATSPWKLDDMYYNGSCARGYVIEENQGGNLPPYFPTIDVASPSIGIGFSRSITSIKSINQKSGSYRRSGALYERLTIDYVYPSGEPKSLSYTTKLAEFESTTHRGVTVRRSSGSRLTLTVVFNANEPLTAQQWSEIASAFKEAQKKGVFLNFTFSY
jgi:hypothetical protein